MQSFICNFAKNFHRKSCRHEQKGERIHSGSHCGRLLRHESALCPSALCRGDGPRFRTLLQIHVCHSHIGTDAETARKRLRHQPCRRAAAARLRRAFRAVLPHPFPELQLHGCRHCLHPSLCLPHFGGADYGPCVQGTAWGADHPVHTGGVGGHRASYKGGDGATLSLTGTLLVVGSALSYAVYLVA